MSKSAVQTIAAACTGILTGLLIGCGMELETGYKPRSLDASPAERRAYYTSPFSPERAAVEQEKHQQNQGHAPGVQP